MFLSLSMVIANVDSCLSLVACPHCGFCRDNSLYEFYLVSWRLFPQPIIVFELFCLWLFQHISYGCDACWLSAFGDSSFLSAELRWLITLDLFPVGPQLNSLSVDQWISGSVDQEICGSVDQLTVTEVCLHCLDSSKLVLPNLCFDY